VIEDAEHNWMYRKNRYLKDHACKSILCVPIPRDKRKTEDKDKDGAQATCDDHPFARHLVRA
jgi:hypothetical protein